MYALFIIQKTRKESGSRQNIILEGMKNRLLTEKIFEIMYGNIIKEATSNIYFQHTGPIKTRGDIERFQSNMTPFDQIQNDNIELTADDRASKCFVSLL